VTLARRRGGITADEGEDVVLALPAARPRPLGTGTMAEGGGILQPAADEHAEAQPGRERVGSAPEGGW
jgi:hypothetical protein